KARPRHRRSKTATASIDTVASILPWRSQPHTRPNRTVNGLESRRDSSPRNRPRPARARAHGARLLACAGLLHDAGARLRRGGRGARRALLLAWRHRRLRQRRRAADAAPRDWLGAGVLDPSLEVL